MRMLIYFSVLALGLTTGLMGCLFETHTQPPTVIFMGNSITNADTNSQLNWNHKSGMAASSLAKDYVHRTLQILKDNGREMSGVLGARDCDFTPCDGPIEEHLHNIYQVKDLHAKYVVVQLGENSSDVEAISGKLRAQYHALLEAIGKAGVQRIFCITPWGETSLDGLRTKAIRLAMLDVSNVELVDITSLSANPGNAGDSTLFKDPAVLWHPGDAGMEGIAKTLSEAILKYE